MKNTKTIAITGASAGLGKALALAYANHGTHLFLSARNEQRLEEVAELCRKKGAKAHVQTVDVCDVKAVEGWLTSIAEHGPINLVIANAGIMMTNDEMGEDKAIEAAHMQVDTNMKAVMTLTLAAERIMREQDKFENGARGQIGIVASLSAMQPIGSIAAYSASKAGVTAFGEAMGEHLAKRDIEVSVVCPGYIQTDMLSDIQGFRPFTMSAEQAAHKTKRAFDRLKPYSAFPLSLVMITAPARLLPTRLRRLATEGFRFKNAK
ncbi:MAG: SDR family NAD(P)-dependent oxidoreductase [Hyphomicrobiales bacterium]